MSVPCRVRLTDFRASEPELVPKGYAQLLGVGCAPAEATELLQLQAGKIAQVAHFVSHILQVSARIPRVRVLCFGSRTRPNMVPLRIRDPLRDPCAGGMWMRRERMAFVKFWGWPIENVVLHELTHAWLDLMAPEFRWPLVFHEGFARLAEYLFCKDCPVRGKGPGGHLTQADVVSVRNLFLYDSRWDDLKTNIKQITRMHRASFWLVRYLVEAGKYRPSLKNMMPRLRAIRVVAPRLIYLWLQEQLGVSMEEWDTSFRRYCCGDPHALNLLR